MRISALKKVLGKDKRYYYYDGSAECDTIDDINKNKFSWNRIDKGFYDFLFDKYSNQSLLSFKNDNEITEFYYKIPEAEKSIYQKMKEAVDNGDKEKLKIRPGCFKNFCFIIVLIIIFYNLIK